MLLAPDKKVILGCFFQLKAICLCASFSGIRNTFFAKICHIFDKYVIAIFFLKFVYIFSPLRTEILPKICIYFSKLFDSLIQMAWHIVHWILSRDWFILREKHENSSIFVVILVIIIEHICCFQVWRVEI